MHNSGFFMGKNIALLDIMNIVSGQLDARMANPARVSPGALSEMDAFAALDPLLGSLVKRYLDAKSTRMASEKQYGACDGMTDMALIVEDSAWCAMQTRYMEVRGDRAMMKQAQALMEESRLEEEAASTRAKEKQTLQFFEQMQIFLRMQEKARQSYYLWLAVLFLCHGGNAAGYAPHYTSQQFNRLAA